MRTVPGMTTTKLSPAPNLTNAKAAALVAGPAVTALLFAIHPPVPFIGRDLLVEVAQHNGAWALAHTIGFFCGILYLLGGWVICDLLAPSRPGTAKVARALLVVGGVAISSISTAELVLGKVARAVGDQGTDALNRTFDQGGTGLFVGGLVLLNVVGTIVVVVSLRRAHLVPTALVALAVLGSVLFWNPSDGPSQWIRVVGELLRLVAMGWIAMRFRRQSAAASPLDLVGR